VRAQEESAEAIVVKMRRETRAEQQGQKRQRKARSPNRSVVMGEDVSETHWA
jgi:hypothetical protein